MTKLKFAVIGAIAAAAFAAVVAFQHQSIAALRQDNQALREQVDQIAPLQAENGRLSNAVAKAAASAAQDSSVRELARLRGEVGVLRDSVGKLRQQTNRMAALQEEIQRLRLSSVAAAQEAATRTPPPAMDPAVKQQNACINNLRLIDSAKQQWALDARKQVTDTPEWTDLQPYLGRGPNGSELPACPSGGVYTIGTVGQPPKCTVAGHVLP